MSLMADAEKVLSKVMRKHPEMVSFVDKLYDEPWEKVAGKWRKRSADQKVLLTVDVEAKTAQLDFS